MIEPVNIPHTRLGRACYFTLGLFIFFSGLPAHANQEPSPSEGALERILQNLEDGLRKSDPRDCSRIEQLAQTLEEAPLKLQKLRAWCTLNGPIKLTAEASIDLQQFLSNQDQEASFLAYLLAARSNPKAAALRLETAWFEAPLNWDGLWYLRTRALLTGRALALYFRRTKATAPAFTCTDLQALSLPILRPSHYTLAPSTPQSQ